MEKNGNNKRIPASMMQMYEKTSRLVGKLQDSKAAADGTLQIQARFLGYPILREVDGRKQNILTTTVPDKNFITSKEGKPFPKPIKISVNLVDMNQVENLATPLEDGSGWRCNVECSFHPDAEKYLQKNYKAFYANEFDKGRTPLSEFIDESGNLCTNRSIILRPNHSCKVEVSDAEGNPFRAKLDDGSSPVVTARTDITLSKCQFEQYVVLKRDDETKQQDIQGYTSIKCKGGVRVSDYHDPQMPLSERIRRQESADCHSMIPMAQMGKGKEPAKWKTFFNLKPSYQSPEGSPEGIIFLPIPSNDLRDFVGSFNNQTTVKTTFRGFVFQWKNTAEDPNMEPYSIKCIGFRDVWKSYGIPDPDFYAHIMMANPIWTLAETALWKSDTLKQDENRRMIEGVQEDNESLRPLKGYYSWVIESATPNYLEMLPKVGIAVSSDWVTEKFADFMGTKGKGDKKRNTLDFKPVDPTWPNPLHERGAQSAVVSLGNPKVDDADADTPRALCHGFNGDFWPRMDKVDFYVLCSHPFNYGTNEAKPEEIEILGKVEDGDFSKSEALINRLITEEGVFWWLFAVNRKAAKYTEEPIKPRPAKKRHVEEENKEEEEATAPQPMDIDPEPEADQAPEEPEEPEEDDEDEAPKKKTKKKATSKATPSKKSKKKQ